MSKAKLDSNIDVQKEKLQDNLGSDFKGEVLGYGTMYSVGADFNCIVPRKWLQNQVDDLGLPETVMPKKISPTYAYKRAVNRLQKDWDKEYTFQIPYAGTGHKTAHKAEVDILEGDGPRLYHIQLRVFFEEDEINEEGGRWDSHDLGHIDYNYDEERVVVKRSESIDRFNAHKQVWGDVETKVRQWTAQMEKLHIARDIRNMMYKLTETRTVIPLQRAVYLFPAGLGDIVDKMSALFDRINDSFKNAGEPIAIRTFEVLDTSEKRDWIEHKVRDELQDNIDKVLDEAFEEFSDDATTEEVTDIIRRNLEGHEGTAEVYNTLLEAEIEVEEVLEERKKEIKDNRKQEILGSIIDQTELDGY